MAKVLQGVRVLEQGTFITGPAASMLLADLGADVVRVDRLVPSGLGVPVAPRFDVTARSRRSRGRQFTCVAQPGGARPSPFASNAPEPRTA